MIIERLFEELEELISDIGFAGIRNTQPVTLQRMEEMKRWLIELSMPEGVGVIDRFIVSMREYHAGAVTASEPVDKLCALEFYLKTITGNLTK